MRAVWMYLRGDLRRRALAWIVLAVFLGVGAGASMTATAGARRSDSAYARFLTATNASDISTGGIDEDVGDWNKVLDTVEHLPQVKAATRFRILAGKARIRGTLYTIPDLFAFSPVGGFPVAVDKPKVIEGRLPAANAGDETAVPIQTAQKFDLHLGDTITVLLGDPFASGGKAAEVHVVGILAVPGLFQGVTGSAPTGVIVSQGFIDRYPNDVIPPINGDFYFSNIKLKRGAADDAAFQAALLKTRYAHLDLQYSVDQLHDVQKAMHPYGIGLWLLGIIGAVVVTVITGQLIARQIALGSADYPVLRALGVDRGGLIALGTARAVVIFLASIPVAIVTTLLLSPLTPIGDARTAEPRPGFAFDLLVVAAGLAILLVLISVFAVFPAWRAARASARGSETSHQRPSAAAAFAAGVSASAPAVAGIRMALEPGRGATSVPVRATLLSVSLVLAALTSTVVFSVSMNHLVDSPSLSGFTYDALVVSQSDNNNESRRQTIDVVRNSNLISSYTNMNVGNARVGGRDAFVFALEPSREIGFSVISGRAPTDELHGGHPEIGVGPTLLQRNHWHIGETVPLVLVADHAQPVEGFVVGTLAIPSTPFGQAEPGAGVMMTLRSYEVWAPDPSPYPPCCVVRFKPGVDANAARVPLQDKGMFVYPRTRRADLNALSNLTRLATMMAFIIFVASAVILAYALLTAIARRRRDLAILKVFGFVRSQIRRTVSWQASTLAIIATAIALPIGVVIGRAAWRVFAGQFGVVPESVVPLYFIQVIFPIMLLIANLTAIVPARAAARTKPASVLRAE